MYEVEIYLEKASSSGLLLNPFQTDTLTKLSISLVSYSCVCISLVVRFVDFGSKTHF